MKNENNRPARNALQRNAGGGFIKIALIIIIALVLLKYVYDIDVLAKAYDAWLWLWGKYGGYVISLWNWIKSKFI